MKYIILIFIIFLISGCSVKDKEITTRIEGENLEEQMIEAYNAGLEALEQGDVYYASKKFNEAELLYPQSEWAPRSSLMASYAFWTQGFYNDSIIELKRFIKLYSKNENLDYAYYLLAMNYYDSIVDEKKDLKPLEEAKKYFNIIINEYSETDYALDSEYKLELIQDTLAAKEMFVARHYIKKEKWIAAINRLKFVIKSYDRTIYVEEALHRLVEIYYIIGLENEAQKYAKILGYNYQSSEWYKQTYKIFNQKYNLIKKTKKEDKKDKLLNKIKSLF
jgi:outer membrane protein assembly factor BamD